MKRLFAVLLTLLVLLMLPALGVAADQDILVNGANAKYDNIQVLHRVCYKYSGEGNDNVYVFYEVVNRGENPVRIQNYNSYFTFLDEYGNEIYRTDLYGMKYHLMPGESTVLFHDLTSTSDLNKDVPFSAIMQAADFGLNLNLEMPELTESTDERYYFDTKAQFRVEESNPLERLILRTGKYKYLMDITMTNTTDVDLKNFEGGFRVDFLMRDENGVPVAVSTMQSTPFTKIKAGETISFTQDVWISGASMFEAYGFFPATCEVRISERQSMVDYLRDH